MFCCLFVAKSVVDLESRRNLKSLRTQLEDKKEEIAKLAQRLLIVDIDVCKLEGAKEAVIKNRDKRKAQTLMTAKEVNSTALFCLKPTNLDWHV